MYKQSFNNRNGTSGCPCKGCEARHPGCHGRCGEYAKWKKKHEQVKAIERETESKYKTLSDDHLRKIWKYRKYGVRHGYGGNKPFD